MNPSVKLTSIDASSFRSLCSIQCCTMVRNRCCWAEYYAHM